ncbi:Expansin [Gossypium australe]|uniref:Expansin n=1 Tax=Gossypium australe TaxID=47621 RepID=A0A5B6UPY9_9ROSI|nr:Expansin [Gossypium australe]
MEVTEKEQSETHLVGLEEMELNISHILERIERFTQLATISIINHSPFWFIYAVSELLESRETMFKEPSNEFEQRLILWDTTTIFYSIIYR